MTMNRKLVRTRAMHASMLVLLALTIISHYSRPASAEFVLPPTVLQDPVPEEAYFGWSSAVGDVNGDGYDDVAVGAYGSYVDGLIEAGEVFLFLGPDLATIITLQDPTPETFGRFGESLAVGDMNGDGYDDLVAGAGSSYVDGLIEAGEVFLFLGGSPFDTACDATLHDPTPEEQAWFGHHLAVGDVNGDGYDDLVAGAGSSYVDGFDHAGEAFLFLGGSPFDTTCDATLHDPTPEKYAEFGFDLAFGDVNGDGYDDLVVGATLSHVGGLAYAGEAFLFLGGSPFDTACDATLHDPTPPEYGVYFSQSLAVGDVNGDGYDDLVVGAFGSRVGDIDDAGEVFVFFGEAPVTPLTVWVDVKPGAWPNPLQLKGKGKLPLAICGTEDFDVTTIDPETVQLTLEGAAEGVSPLRWSYEDVATPYMGEPCGGHDLEGDGILDLMLKFSAQEVIESLGLDAFYNRDLVILLLTGNLKAEFGGTPIHGQDCIVVLSKVTRPFTIIGPWSGGEMAAFLPVLQAFEEQSGIEVVYKTYRAYELVNMLPTAFAAGTTPGDVIFMWSWFIKEQGPEGHLLDVTDLIDEDEFAPGALDPVTVGDVLYGGAYTGKVKPGFWYKRSFFTDHGLTPPTTWDEFVTLLSDLAAIPGLDSPIASGDLVGWPLSDVAEHFLITFGGPQLHRDLIAGTVAWTDPQVRSIFADRLVPLLTAGSFSAPMEWTLALAEWWDEQYGLYFMGSWITAMVDTPADLELFPLPDADGLVFAADFFCIPTYTKYREEAEELFRFLASDEAQSIQVAQGGHLATNVDVPLHAYPPVDRQVAEILEGKELLTDLDDTIGGDFQTTFWDQMKLLWIDPTRLDDVLAALEAVAP